MPELKFSCPGCGQHIQCEQQWSGQQIACPACGASLTVPQLQPVAVATASVAATASAAQPQPARRLVPRKNAFPVKSVAIWSIGTVAFVVVMFFVLRRADVLQGVFNKKQKEIVASSSGGELTHIGQIYQTLDATDPAKAEAAQMRANARMEKERNAMIESLKVQADPTMAMPLASAVWTADESAASILTGRVNGTSGGAPFKVETVHLDPNNLGGVLVFQEGVGTDADHELFIYLDANNVTNLAGRSWTVGKASRGKDLLQIVKRWTINPKFAPVPKTFGSGYLLHLEFGQPMRDWQPGQIYLALPDQGHTVLAGAFSLPMPRSEEDDKALQILQGIRR